MQLTKDFSLEDLCFSEIADKLKINNTPSEKEIERLTLLATTILQPISDSSGVKININSGFRSSLLNSSKKISGSRTSQHLFGDAADIWSPSLSTEALAKIIISLNLPYDQLIEEYNTVNKTSWVHVSQASINKIPRKEHSIIKITKNGSLKKILI